MRLLLWVAVWCVAQTQAARLLAVLPTNTRSHYVMYGRLLEELARRGHHVTVISHFPMKNPSPNVEEISVAGTIADLTNNLTQQQMSLKPEFVRNLEKIMAECVEACDAISQVPAVRVLLNSSRTFDMIIVEVFGTECFLPLGRKFEAPVVGLLSSVPLPWVNDQLGNPDAAAYVSSYMMGFGQNMNLWERFANTISIVWAKIQYSYMSQIPSQIIADRMFGPGPKLDLLAQNYSLVLSNSHFSINEVRPLVPALVEVGGLHLDDSQKLSKELKTLLDESSDGVIYWSFGSMARIETIPSETLAQIFEVFAELPQTVLVKMNRALLSRNLTVPDNVFTMDWIPQYKTLCHHNVKLFISHGGLLGTQEAVACGTPMLTIPLYADQALNARAMSDRGVARVIQLKNINVHSWKYSITDLLHNIRYKENAEKLRDIFLDRPLPPLDMGVYWIEYVLRHNGAHHLQSPAAGMPMYQYLLLDVLALSLIITLLTLYLLHKLFRYLCTRCLKWLPKEKLMFEKTLIKRHSIFLCLFSRHKLKTN